MFPKSWLSLYNSEKPTWINWNRNLRKNRENQLLLRRPETLSRSLTFNLLTTTTNSSKCWKQEDTLSPTACGIRWEPQMSQSTISSWMKMAQSMMKSTTISRDLSPRSSLSTQMTDSTRPSFTTSKTLSTETQTMKIPNNSFTKGSLMKFHDSSRPPIQLTSFGSIDTLRESSMA